MKNSNFDTQLKHKPNMHTETHCRRQRNVMCYNPPYSKNVKTNIECDFLQLIRQTTNYTNYSTDTLSLLVTAAAKT